MRTYAWLLILTLGAGAAGQLDDVVARMATYEDGQSRAAVAELEALIRAALGEPERLRAIERSLDALLGSKATPAAKGVACRQLSLIGTGASVPVLVEMLGDGQTAEPARYALERIPGPAVSAALRKALAASTGRTRTGIVNTLGMRRDSASVAALGAVLESEPAAAHALAAIGGAEACGLLDQASRRAATPALLEAVLECADALKGPAAAAIYQRLYGPDQPEMIRVAALRRLGPAAAEAALKSDRPKIRAVAIQLASSEALVRAFPALPPAAQVQVLASLSQRNFAGARPLVADALKSRVAEVRIAAIQALAALGDAGSVYRLAETAAQAEGAEQAAARESLSRLRGPRIDAAIGAGIPAATGKVKAELVRAAGERGIRDAAPALLAAARDPDADVRRESLRALRETAGAEHLQAVIELLGETRTSADRLEAERALIAILRNSQPQPVEALVAAYRASGHADARASLLMVMAVTGMRDTLPAFREALRTGDADLRRAAVLALSEWPSGDVAADLIAPARDRADIALQVLALRGYIKLVTRPSQRPAAETARLLGDALDAATQSDEKKAVLAALQRTPCAEALAIAEKALSDPEVAAEAKAAATSIRRTVERNR